MTHSTSGPRILLISQWPNVKNAEFELIEKIKQVSYKVVVVDVYGCEVHSGLDLNKPNLRNDFDFAVSLHYETPNLLNIPTYLLVCNPLAFMHLRDDYYTVIFNYLRSYDGYLLNGSDVLKTHISSVIGSEWDDEGLEMYPSCSVNTLMNPKKSSQLNDHQESNKIFYCGINWERARDKNGRSQGLLDRLEDKGIIDLYGPKLISKINPWRGFKSYKGEIPFDGSSLSNVMKNYRAVLALSSPAHMKSETASSRVFEGIAAGVPVISDENPYIKRLFGDLIYYFQGDNDEQRVASISRALKDINDNPAEAAKRVIEAQKLITRRYSFDYCLNRLSHQKNMVLETKKNVFSGKQLDIFLFYHDITLQKESDEKPIFPNSEYIIEAANYAAKNYGIKITINYCTKNNSLQLESQPNITVKYISPGEITSQPWRSLRLGQKVSSLVKYCKSDFATFLTQSDFPMFNNFSRALDWFAADLDRRRCGVHVGGYFIYDKKNNVSKRGNINAQNSSSSLYRWSQDSLYEHYMSTLLFASGAFDLLVPQKINNLDITLPMSVLVDAIGEGWPTHRSRFYLMRVQRQYYGEYIKKYHKVKDKSYWSQHYELLTNYNHELNALYDIHHESAEKISIVNELSGDSIRLTRLLIDGMIKNYFSTKTKYFYKRFKKIFKRRIWNIQ